MGIRQTLNENPAVSIGITAGIILIAIIIIVWEMMPSRGGAAAGRQQFYTDDDGKTWFADDATKIPPFKDKDGKMAVKAVLFRCKGSKPFVAYLEQFSPEGVKKMEQARSQPGGSRALGAMMQQLTEVRKPGVSHWVKYTPQSPQAYLDVTTPTCPDGSKNGLELVLPGQE